MELEAIKLFIQNPEFIHLLLNNFDKVVFIVVMYILYKDKQNVLQEGKCYKELIIKATGKTVLSNTQLINIARNAVLGASVPKLIHIITTLSVPSYEIETEKGKTIVEEKIITFLNKRSEEYFEELDEYIIPNKGVLLGQWVKNNFPVKPFMKELMGVILDENLSLVDKFFQCSTIMIKYQNQTWKKLHYYINNTKG